MCIVHLYVGIGIVSHAFRLAIEFCWKEEVFEIYVVNE